MLPLMGTSGFLTVTVTASTSKPSRMASAIDSATLSKQLAAGALDYLLDYAVHLGVVHGVGGVVRAARGPEVALNVEVDDEPLADLLLLRAHAVEAVEDHPREAYPVGHSSLLTPKFAALPGPAL